MKIRAVSLALAFLLVARGTMAQPTQTSAGPPTVPPGEKVLVTTTDGEQISGRVRSITAQSFTIETRTGSQAVASNRIARIVVKDSIRNGLMIGLGIGAGVGLAGGLLVNAICINETGSCPGTVLLLTAIGGSAGAGLGAGFDGLRHSTVFDTIPAVAGEYSPEIIANVGVGRSQARGRTFDGFPSAGVAWAIRHTSGFGFAVDAARTIGRSVHTVSCAQAQSGDSSAANCVGKGEEGVVDTTTATARAQYYFSHGRVQPYVSGGAAMCEDSLLFVRAVRPSSASSTPLVTYQALERRRGIAPVFGGGARIGVTNRLSIRPDVAVYAAGQHVRISVGAGFGW